MKFWQLCMPLILLASFSLHGTTVVVYNELDGRKIRWDLETTPTSVKEASNPMWIEAGPNTSGKYTLGSNKTSLSNIKLFWMDTDGVTIKQSCRYSFDGSDKKSTGGWVFVCKETGVTAWSSNDDIHINEHEWKDVYE